MPSATHPRVLFLTRKFPPRVGGMETLSKGITDHLPKELPLETRTWGGSQVWLPFVFLSFLWSLIRRRNHIDLILLGDAVLSPLGWIAKRLLKKRVALLLHGLDMTFPNPLYQSFLRRFSYGFDAYICNSQATLQEATSRNYSPLSVVHPGIEPVEAMDAVAARHAFDALTSQPLPKEAFLVGFLGRPSERKGLPWFLTNVFPQLPHHVHLVIAGGTEQEDVHSLVNDTSLRERIHVLGRISDREREVFFSALDLFLMPNITIPGDQEGFGIVAIESSVRGTPVLAADLEGVADAVLQDKTGWRVPPNQPEAFIRAVTHLSSAEGTATRTAVQQHATQETLKAFSWESIARTYAKVLKRVYLPKSH